MAESSHCVLLALVLMDRTLSQLRVHPDRMRTNLEAVGPLVCTERLMLELGVHVGKQTAHGLVYAIAQRAMDGNRTIAEELSRFPEAVAPLTPSDLEQILDPFSYMGSCTEIVESVTSAAQVRLAKRRTHAAETA